jgi:hypothetical protein
VSKITFNIVVLALLAPCVLKGTSIKTIKTLATNPYRKGVQLLTKKGYQYQTSTEVQTLNWHCLKQEKEISFTQSAIYTNCDALNLCHLGTQAALRSLFKGEPRAIETFSVHDHKESTRWHCLEPDGDNLTICLSSQNSPYQQDRPHFGWPNQLTATR